MSPKLHQLLTTISLFLLVANTAFTIDLPPDVAEMKVQDLHAGGDELKRYFVIQRPGEAPAEGWRTLYVLPGGSGSAEFLPFVTRVAKNALSKSYLVIQLVAPVWTAKQAENIVWPDTRSGVPEMKFGTTEFFLTVRNEVESKHKLDPRFCFTLTWSSSGMSGYALSLHPETRITGTFVAMSVFRPRDLPDLAAAKGHPYYLLHSPQDFIPFAHAETASEALGMAGGIVNLHPYEGGHGWRGDVFGSIGLGVEWLEKQR